MVEPVFESVADNQLTIPARPTARMCKRKKYLASVQSGPTVRPGVDRETSYEIL